MKKVSEINLNSKMVISKEKVTLPAQPQKDVVSVSGENSKNSIGKTNELSGAAKMYRFKKTLKELVGEYVSLDKPSFSKRTRVVGAFKLGNSEMSNEDIAGTLMSISPSQILEGEEAVSEFKKSALKNFDGENAKKASIVLDKIGNLFKNNNFSRIVYTHVVQHDDGAPEDDAPYFFDYDFHFLVGVTDDNWLIGVNNRV